MTEEAAVVEDTIDELDDELDPFSVRRGRSGSRKEHRRSLLEQLTQLGRCSSHFIWRFLQGKQPFRDFR